MGWSVHGRAPVLSQLVPRDQCLIVKKKPCPFQWDRAAIDLNSTAAYPVRTSSKSKPSRRAGWRCVRVGRIITIYTSKDNELVVLSQQKQTETRSSCIFKARLVEWKYHLRKLDNGRLVVKDSGLIPIKELISISS